MANDIDFRQNKFTVARINADAITMADGGTTEGTVTEAINGLLVAIKIKLPDSTNGVTATLSIRDSDGFEVYSKVAIADNGNTVLLGVDVPLSGVMTLGMTASGDPGADWTTTNLILEVV